MVYYCWCCVYSFICYYNDYCCSCKRLIMRSRYIYKHLIIIFILLALGIVYYKYDPSASLIFPKCPVMSLTGYPCAGCGSQRAIHSLLHLNLQDAIRYNFLVVLFIPTFFILLFASPFIARFPTLSLLPHHPIIAYGILVIIIAWWILRIFLGWYV